MARVETAWSAAHSPLIAALLRPEAYPHPAEDPRLHETHLSWVVLAGEFAYKVKKPVRFGFVDFGSVERRTAACRAEVRLNRRLCRDVYLGVGQIVECDGSYFVGGRGHVAEPVVRMRRLPAAGMLPHLLAEGSVGPSLMTRVARRLARFHAVAATGPGVDEHGRLEAVRRNWQQSFAEMAPRLGATLPVAGQRAIARYVEEFARERTALFDRRVATGRIRDGHGDLHAANICVAARHLWLFDCLEFDPALRCGDVAADVAFLAMDLDHAGRADLARHFVDAYVGASGDPDLRDLLPFYACYRAYVRGKVLSLRLAEAGLSSEEQAVLSGQARRYFELAHAYVAPLPRPVLIAIMGLPASGKTSLAGELASRLGIVHLSSDVIRKELAGLPATAHRPDAFGEGLYSQAMSRRAYATLRRRAASWLRLGNSIVVDATFGWAAERAALRRLAARLGVPLVVLVCRADDAVLRARLTARTGRAVVASDARPELWPALRQAFTEPSEFPEAVDLDMTLPREDAVQAALKVVRGDQARA